MQLWSLHEQCHQLRGWGVVSLLYLLACALQYRYLNNTVQAALAAAAWPAASLSLTSGRHSQCHSDCQTLITV
jgi:hypothetical protein